MIRVSLLLLIWGVIVDFIQWEILLYEELGFRLIAILEVYASNFKFLPDTIGILGALVVNSFHR